MSRETERINRIRRNRRAKRKRKQVIVIAIAVILVILTGAMVTYIVNRGREYITEGLKGSPQAGQTEEEMLEQLQRQVDENMFRIMLNTQPTMVQSTGETSIIVQNAIENDYMMKVAYYNKNNKMLYETPLLHPGESELSAVFSGKLTVGSHELTAITSSYEYVEDELQLLNTSSVEIQLTVK